MFITAKITFIFTLILFYYEAIYTVTHVLEVTPARVSGGNAIGWLRRGRAVIPFHTSLRGETSNFLVCELSGKT